MSQSELHLFEGPSVDTSGYPNSIDIIELMDSVSQEDKTEIYSKLYARSTKNISHNSLFFRTFYTTFFNPAPGNKAELINKIALFKCIREMDEFDSVSLVVTHNVSPEYECVVRDICETKDLQFESRGTPKDLLIADFMYSTTVCMLYLLEQLLFGISYSLINYKNSLQGNPVFVPNPNRMKSMSPIIDEYDDYSVVLPWPKLLQIIRGKKLSEGYKYKSINQFASIFTPFYSLRLILSTSIHTDHYRDEISVTVEDEFGFRIPNSVSYSVKYLIANNISCLCCYYPSKNLHNTLKPSSLIIGSAGGYSMAILNAVVDSPNTKTYHIPHSVTRAFEPILPRTTQFLSSITGFTYLSQLEFDTGNLKCTGRPYLKRMYDQDQRLCDQYHNSKRQKKNGRINILIGTQPYSDSIRYKFIDTVVSGIDKNENSVNLRVKTHPNEDIDWYNRYPDLSIYDDKLEKHLAWADVVITINSNIGIESMIYGNATLYANLWDGRVIDFPFVRLGSVWHLTNETQVVDELSQLTLEEVSKVGKSQKKYLISKFMLESDIVSEIVDEIE